MSKLTNLLIPLVFISTGAISCANYGFVKKQDIKDQQFINTINQDGSERQVLPQPEKKNMASQAIPANIPTIEKPSSIANTNNKQSDNIAIGKDHVDNLTGVEQGQIKLNQVGLAHLTLGIAYAERDLIDQAICEFQSAIEANPHHLESYVRLGTTYGLKGMVNEALSEFKKAIDINLNEAVTKIVFSALPVTANQQVKTDVVNAHINLGNAYKEEGKLKRSQLEYEKALELKPEHPIASKSLSEIYYTIGTSCLENKEYDNAIDAFNTVLKLNPGFPQIKDALERAHYNLGINYAENGKLNKAIIEFNKTMEINLHYAMQDKNSFNIIGSDKKLFQVNTSIKTEIVRIKTQIMVLTAMQEKKIFMKKRIGLFRIKCRIKMMLQRK
jgi:Lipoprotein NlpI, contains TPR repeats